MLMHNTPARNIYRLTDKKGLPVRGELGYSDPAPAKSGVRICTLKQLLATHDAPRVFFCVRAYAHPQNTVSRRSDSMVALAGQPSGWLGSSNSSSANPVSVTTPTEICTSGGDSFDKLLEIIVMMATPARTQFKFLFLAVKRADSTDIPHRIETTAPDEQAARLMLVADYILAFAGRVPAQEVAHG
ncbi:ash family protein [Morganella morganii subsp. morganii]|uniref:host cell division inhibitor Icd-like protein n=1 Tax=Morganella morganii TaxID=582 RepID=UPI001BD93B4F|nr:host cell division inhibitor Icd-like protein [Morganella morganii]MBT0369637.1 ash family protein [Morganella morganii subsp. morganii]